MAVIQFQEYNFRFLTMQKITTFFLICSGADRDLLQQCKGERAKYAGIGATVFFTGLLAALSASYALFTVFDNVWLSIGFGLVWGLMIFNLDRFIVSSMRKNGKPLREWTLALPRIVLAVLISLVIAKPLELKIFEKEIGPELVVMEQEKYAEQEGSVRKRFQPLDDSLKQQIALLKKEISIKAAKRDELVKLAQEEADGTGGSKQKNLGPIYKVKKANAEAAELELKNVMTQNDARIAMLERSRMKNDSLQQEALVLLEKSKRNGMAARMEALDRLTDQSQAIAWAHWFIVLLFIAVETSPIFVKLISPSGPYDDLLRMSEHDYKTQDINYRAKVNSDLKQGNAYPQYEKDFLYRKLDAELE